jgi:hypothetical protein
MYKNGKKIQTNKKFTYDEMRKVAAETAALSQLDTAETFLDIALMAYMDCGGEKAQEFISLIDKYCADYEDGYFSKTALKKYNADNIRSFFK